jgi:hypothetical protein
MRICQRCGWTLGQWAALSDAEKDVWLAWDVRQQRALAAWRDALIAHDAYTPEAATQIVCMSF